MSTYYNVVDDNKERDRMKTVQETARELGLSIEQVRRHLREGKLSGQKVGQQWFIMEASLEEMKNPGRAIRALSEARRVRWKIKERHGDIDILELLDLSRGDEGLR
jgi:excisionase family DNA binding protein